MQGFRRAGLITAIVLGLVGAVSLARLSWTPHASTHHNAATSGPHPPHGMARASMMHSAFPRFRDNLASHKIPEQTVSRPHIVWNPIPFGAKRRAEMAAYAGRHYGFHSWRLRHPRVIVEHYTGGTSLASAWSTFASNTPDLGELPGTCAHFIVAPDGAIYQLVHLDVMCRHTVGLNWTAIGIEHVGTSDAQLLHDQAQMSASLHLTLWLMQRFHIQLRNVIGHAESLTSPYHHERVPSWRCQTHSDWQPADMQVYRGRLAHLARRYNVPLGPPRRSRPSHC